LKKEAESIDLYKKRIMAVELLASIQPLIFFQHEAEHMLSIQNILYYYASPGSVIWQRIAVSITVILLELYFICRLYSSSTFVVVQLAVCAFVRSQGHMFDLVPLIDHYGDSLLPYLPANYEGNAKEKKTGELPIVIKNMKMKYVKVTSLLNRTLWDRQTAFPDSTLRGPRREIRYVSSNLKLSARVLSFY